jgi:ABC-type transporter Mla maintaining outer membrane lipid asymmetry ATPase subunit MlaF
VLRAGRTVLDEPAAGLDPAELRARYDRLVA